MKGRITGKTVDVEVYLVEVQTLDGLSGSPVFLQETIMMDVGHETIRPVAFVQPILFGIYSGSWDGRPGDVLAADRDLQGGARVPVGVGTVVPIEHAIALLRDHPDMKKTREYWIEQQTKLPVKPAAPAGEPELGA